MKTVYAILDLIQGKKATIFAILNAIIVYLLARNIIDPNLAELLAAIIVILGGSANYVGGSQKYLDDNRRQISFDRFNKNK